VSVLLEVCIDSIESAKAAKQGGARRLEVCSSLAVGGTTPSFGLVEYCAIDLEMPVMMMIRPHDGNFVYGDEDLQAMLTDIEVAKSLGVQGVVFGALSPSLELDLATTKALVEAAEGIEVTFHRAFDLVPDPISTLAQLEELGITRVLTSGQKATAMEGADLVKQLVSASKGISILPGSGVNSENAKQLVQQTGVQEFHASASVSADETQSNDHVQFGTDRRITSADKVRAIVRVLEGL